MTKFPHLSRIFIITLLVASIASCSLQQNHKEKRKVGVAFLVHGGFEEFGQNVRFWAKMTKFWSKNYQKVIFEIFPGKNSQFF